MGKLVHLHRHSEYSLLDGTGSANQYAERAAELGQNALALTDHGSLAGALHHYNACHKVGIKPIMGCEVYFKPDRLTKDETNKEYYHLVLLAKNIEGWHNLIRITSEAYASGFYYKPCVDWDLLKRYHDGLICQTACISSYPNKSLIKGFDKEFIRSIKKLKGLFKDDLFIELMPHDYDDQRFLNHELVQTSDEYGIGYIATIDAHYPYEDWADTQDVVLMMATGQSHEKRKKKHDAGEDVYKFDCNTLYLMNDKQVSSTFEKYHPSLGASVVQRAISNTSLVADKVENFTIDKSRKAPKAEGNPEEILKLWCLEGLKRVGKAYDQEYIDRMEFELSVLKNNDALDYFVIVGDLVRWSISNGIRIGAGRGSAAGCLVSYLIGITLLDPIAHGLLFERFLNPDRKGMPDIDLDFQSDRRDEVKTYLATKYGQDHVANVGAFQTFRPRAAIQKVGRVYDIYTPIYTEEIDPTETRDLEHLRRLSDRVDEFATKYPEPWRHALRVQGQVHTQSKHAGAVVVTDKPVADYMPTMRGKNGELVTQWGARADFNIIDEYGFMKIDLLGIKGLAMQEYACAMIESRTGEKIDLNKLPIMQDGRACEADVLAAFDKGLVLGVFQFTGSPGFARLIRHIGADWLGDLGAANAIYRPGPLGGGVDRSYAARKQGKEDVNYYHESAEACLKETYGLIVYQEQIMELAKQMAGFTGGEADTFRKAISKEYRLGLEHVKKFLEDKGFKEKWQEGCNDNGIKPVIFNHVWDLILAFGDYGFNKSHAYAYAVQSYQDMYLKVKYPTEFYAALLTYDPELASRAIREARHFGVSYLSPDVNKSSFGFTVTSDGIRFGLKAVKNLGDVGVKAILEGQPFRSYEDFVDRIPPRACNKTAKESLMYAGAFDSFGIRKDWTADEKSLAEKKTIGIAISDSEILNKYHQVVLQHSNSLDYLYTCDENSGFVVGGEIISVKKINSKRGPMGFFSIDLDGEEYNCTAFTNEWDEFNELIEVGKPVMVRGRKNTRKNGDIGIIVDQMCSVEELVMALAKDDTNEPHARRNHSEN